MADIALFPQTDEAERWLKQLDKRVSAVKDGKREFGGVLSPVVFQDIIEHFEGEDGSQGPWKAWSKVYADHMAKIGKSGNKILQDSGRLRQAFTPQKYRSVSEGILWFNPAKTAGGFPYAAAHDEGGGKLPKRDFMWLADKAQEKISNITLEYILKE